MAAPPLLNGKALDGRTPGMRGTILGLALLTVSARDLWGADDMTVLTAGASVDVRDGDRWQWFGELSAFRVWERFGLGGVIGSSLRMHYMEVEPMYFGSVGTRGIAFGINPGVVLDRTGTDARFGFQTTAWIWPRIPIGDAGVAPLPVAFFRSESYSLVQHDWSVGLMLKVPVWVW